MLESVTGDRSILLIGTSFKDSSIALRERLARVLSTKGRRELVHSLPRVSESSLLITCNRVEAIFLTDDPRRTGEAFFELLSGISGSPERSPFYVLEGVEAIRHLFRVASGLDSLATGEEQILGQVRKVGIEERVAGNAKGVLSALFDTAVQVGERTRKKYRAGEFDRSASAVAIRVARRKLGRKPRKVLLIGTGKMIQLAASELRGTQSQLYVATKRLTNQKLPGKTTTYDRIGDVASGCDLIVSATNHDGFVVRKEDLKAQGPRVIIDLGFPRNVDPRVRNVRGTQLFDLDDLARERETSRGGASDSLVGLERRIAQEAEEFERRLIATRLTKTLPALYLWAESVRRSESESALRRLSTVSEKEKRVVEVLGRRIVSKILAPPTRFVRSSESTSEELRRIGLVNKTFMLADSKIQRID